MSKTLQERVDYALNQLVEHIVPDHPQDDDAAAEERLDEAYQIVRERLGSAGDSALTSDVHHAADLIKKRLIRDNTNPEKALSFSHLYSRLLSAAVLNKKWEILYFLYQVSDTGANQIPPLVDATLSTTNRQTLPPPHMRKSDDSPALPLLNSALERQYIVDSPAFNDAFSSTGLRRLPVADVPGASYPEPPVSKSRKERPRVDRRPNGDTETSETPHTIHRGQMAEVQPSEAAMLRDLPFTLQGLSSNNFKFQSHRSLQLPKTLPAPLLGLLHALAEPCLLYKDLQAYVDANDGGLVKQSFRSALGAELRSYLGLVATLEGQIRRALTTLGDTPSRQEIGKAGVTLRRCIVWTRDATMGLRLMSLMVEQSKDQKGGRLISVVHSFALRHGDPFVVSFAERLLSYITRPFYEMLRQWIYDGELSDPYQEFFVSEMSDIGRDDDGNHRKAAATSVWQEKYKLDTTMTPTIITDTFANKVFLIGKSLNFIRHGCNDAAWVESYSKSASKELRYGDVSSLETSIDEAYKTTMARLISLMDTRFRLFDHLTALKNYLLLGSGDFIAVLMESLSSVLDRPANTQYRHTLTAQLEHAVRNSNAQYDSPDVLRRLDSRMLELSHGEIGWDVFTLEYKISPPVDVIVTPYASKQYLKVFNFLWRVKRVEFALTSAWRRAATGSRSFLGVVDDKLDRDWKAVRCSIAEMVHFVNQLQYYILFEVIESSWAQLMTTMRKPESTLDDLIQAHATYLTSITRKGLLGAGGSSGFTAQLHELLKIMLSYKDAVDGLYSVSVAEFTRRQESQARIENRTAAGRWGTSDRDNDRPSSADDPLETSTPRQQVSPLLPIPGVTSSDNTSRSEDQILSSLRHRLAELSAEFKKRVNHLLGDLVSQPDADMRWLAMVMNFNDCYTPVRRRRAPAGTSTGDKSARAKEKERETNTVKEAKEKPVATGSADSERRVKAKA